MWWLGIGGPTSSSIVTKMLVTALHCHFDVVEAAILIGILPARQDMLMVHLSQSYSNRSIINSTGLVPKFNSKGSRHAGMTQTTGQTSEQ